MKVQICYETTIASFDIRLVQVGTNCFDVVYGKSVKKGLTYVRAAQELGECIMHAAACEGKLTNDMEY